MSVSLKMNIIRREEWGALPAKRIDPMELPVKYVIYSIENNYEYCTTQDECTKKVREIQKHFMDQGLDDIPYSFLIGNDGNVYEGRGWSSKPGPDVNMNPMFKNHSTLDIAVISGQKEITPEKLDLVKAQLQAAEEFVQLCIQEKKVVSDYETSGLSDDVKDSQEPKEPKEFKDHENLENNFEEFAIAHPELFPVMSKRILEMRAKKKVQAIA